MDGLDAHGAAGAFALAGVLGYVFGSIPFGLILARMGGAGDLRAIGSGNIGATNVLRTGRKGLAAGTLLLDLAKGAAAVCLARALWPGSEGLAALGAVIGHCFPVWLQFRGGKGVATLMGVSMALAWPIGLVYAVVWLGMLYATRISSVGGMSAAVASPIAALVFGHPRYAAVLAPLALLVVWLHRANIARLLAGTEPRVGKGR
ncbi:acyl-phosphate glycerol-3-phosphate acyltransferase [Novosphingobium nitrogenifigens DSM 19370]|uniref:Glycerol-3-phosphate acyltransferase n=1 Tax=Novosphingobium nitrogenifigens DSM 19370 TaxID=983920 RepID=F1ZA62_9SPHN|nr:glycerol-3-phosphate 1-O-acyltransferase PlsY [Novosphingobium nitrogenifigens]EGD58530.1 acyl-phosphate glycerol-3-phosphate acyltransferase [Novosphingobium nitrogenifigens DSM 19370]